MAVVYWVFIKDIHCLVIPDEEATFATQEKLDEAGFELLWDSAPSDYAGAKYAAQTYGAIVPVDRRVIA